MYSINKMRFFLSLAVGGAIMLAAAAAQAQPKPTIFGWWPDHWERQFFEEPYLENGKHTHNRQWDNSPWRPEHWAQQHNGDAMEVIRGFYRARILTNQYTHNNIPVLEVGPGFYMLGGEDKRRVARMIDYVYGITTDELYGKFMLHDWRSKRAIGSYTAFGLQIQ